jgi:uncharacterized OsmC-like protein
MDIFFCDLCGARVTVADLRSGRGLRRNHDVVCGDCIASGQAGTWVERRPDPAERRIAAARDGLATMKDLPPQPPAVAAPAAQPAAAAAAAPATPQQAAEEAVAVATLEPPAIQPPTSATRLAEARGSANLAAAAGSFGAMASAAPKPISAAAEVEDPPELVEDEDVVEAPSPAAAQPAAGLSPFQEQSAAPGPERQPVARPPSGRQGAARPGSTRTPTPAAKAPARTATPAPVKSSNRQTAARPGRGSSAARSAAHGDDAQDRRKTEGGSQRGGSTRRTARANAAGPSPKQLIMMSVIGCSAVLLIGGIAIATKLMRKGKQEQGVEQVDVAGNLRMKMDDARDKIRRSIGTKDPAKLQEARRTIQLMRDEEQSFEKAVMAQGWKEDDIAAYLKQIGWADLNQLDRTIRDELATCMP